MSHIDLNQPPPNHTFSVSVDREETDGERRVRLFKDVALFVTALSFVGMVFSFPRSAWECRWTLNNCYYV